MLEEVKCKNCGSTELVLKNDIWVCVHCGARFIEISGRGLSKKKKTAEEYLEKARDADYEGKYGKMGKYIEKALDAEPENPHAWLWQMRFHETEGNIFLLVSAGTAAIKYNTGQDKEIITEVYDTFIEAFEAGTKSSLSSVRDIVLADLNRAPHFLSVPASLPYEEKMNDLQLKVKLGDRNADDGAYALAHVPIEYLIEHCNDRENREKLRIALQEAAAEIEAAGECYRRTGGCAPEITEELQKRREKIFMIKDGIGIG